jgi:circadian clock protein KaiC
VTTGSTEEVSGEPGRARVSTGVVGLDEILGGGLPAGHLYMVEGESGAGKTTLGLHFLIDGRRRGERTLWITLSETERELTEAAASHGWSLDGIDVCNPSSLARTLSSDEAYSFFSPADVELDEIWTTIMEAANRIKPSRVVFDPFSDVRHLSRETLRYRRQVLGLREFFAERGATVLLMQEMTRGTSGDLQAEALVHGYLTLHQDAPLYGGQRRRLRVHKMRGMAFRDGYHDFAIHTGGVEVYPRLTAAEHLGEYAEETISSGLPALDTLLGGGIPRGSSLLILGAAGVGKSTLAAQYAHASVGRNERVALFIFDETTRTFSTRGEGLGIPVRAHIAEGRLAVRQIDSAEFSPGQFTRLVMREVEDEGAQVVIIDSLSGYLNAMPEEHALSAHLHELLTYLSNRNVVTILTLAQHGLVGNQVASPVDISYLADTVLLLRYFEASGAIRRAISVLKKRSGDHERYLRDMRIGSEGITIGEPLSQFRGVLSGQPEFTGTAGQLVSES